MNPYYIPHDTGLAFSNLRNNRERHYLGKKYYPLYLWDSVKEGRRAEGRVKRKGSRKEGRKDGEGRERMEQRICPKRWTHNKMWTTGDKLGHGRLELYLSEFKDGKLANSNVIRFWLSVIQRGIWYFSCFRQGDLITLLNRLSITSINYHPMELW